jgi:hypothetical protein
VSHKPCARCREILPLEDFRIRDGGKGKYHESYCIPCTRSYTREWHERNPGKQRQYRLLQRYGMSEDDFEAMLEMQDGKCAVCEEVPERQIHIDHDHVTGEVRGLLCFRCNITLGKVGDDPDLLQKMIEYLKRSEPCSV